MNAIDTNILIRFLTGDDDAQAKKVYSLFKQAEAERKELFVPLVVALEMIWVLESVYDISRTQIIETINDLLSMPVLAFEKAAVLQQLVIFAPRNKMDLSDILIALSAKICGCSAVLTFDKKAAGHDLFELVDPLI
jgi:predicted nucleic-acid-binding protein